MMLTRTRLCGVVFDHVWTEKTCRVINVQERDGGGNVNAGLRYCVCSIVCACEIYKVINAACPGPKIVVDVTDFLSSALTEQPSNTLIILRYHKWLVSAGARVVKYQLAIRTCWTEHLGY